MELARTDCAHCGKVRQAGGEKHIGTRFVEGLKATNGVIQARRGVEEIVRARSQDEGKRECMSCLCACRNPFDSQAKIVKWTVFVASRVLNRASN